MFNTSVGLIELTNISKGIYITDLMLKTADIKLISANSVCPGKYFIIISGSLSSVEIALDSAIAEGKEYVVDYYKIGNVSDQVQEALAGTTEVTQLNALGIIETYTGTSAIQAADAANKAAMITLIEIRIASGMAGKGIVFLTGDVADVTEAVAVGKQYAVQNGDLCGFSVIPSPHKELWKKII